MSRHRLERLANRLHQAANIKDNLDTHLAQQLAYSNTRQGGGNETGIRTGGFNDPTMQAIMARAHIIDHHTAVETALQQIETAINGLDIAMRKAWGSDRPANINDRQECYQCRNEVAVVRRPDSTWSYDGSGLCDEHLTEKRRRVEADARRARRHRAGGDTA